MSIASFDVIVVGAGPAGLTAATGAARAGLKALCLDKLAPGGRRRRMYSLTKAGSSALAERRKAWGRFAGAVDTLLGGGRAWPA